LKNSLAMTSQQARLPPASKAADFQFERPDWVLFRSVDTLSQKAGVPTNRLRRLVLAAAASTSANLFKVQGRTPPLAALIL
jgi:hypothetical protein